ncbi:MAG: single-stranded-DNA-specific exonuclease RecJ [Sarcina sp.]
MVKEKWMLRPGMRHQDKVKYFQEELGIDRLTAIMLLNRDVKTLEEAKMFLNGSLDKLHDPYLMKDMKKGVDRMKKAILSGEKITIYGDYDCDGVSSTSILYKALTRCGADFNYHVPDREKEGYGMNCNRVRELAKEGTTLIITCDNGIAAFEEVKLAQELGMDVILTDHHDIQLVDGENGEKVFAVPNAYAVINPHQHDCTYPFKLLCGAGVAYKFSVALYREMGIPHEETLELLEIASIATVCDVVDLRDENRIIVKAGLKMLTNSNNIGINALKKLCDLEDKEITAYHLGFVIGPCINATGRLESATISVELLTESSMEKAQELAKSLQDLNERRKELTSESVEEVLKQIEKDKLYNDKVILVYNPNIHESIAGIVAGRVKEKYNLPTIVMTAGKEMPKGSARSIEEYNMFEELSKCKHLMPKFGGHPMAAGLSSPLENLPVLRKMLNDNCKLTADELLPKVKIDVAMNLNYVDEKLVETISKLEPFGKGNASPVIAAKNIVVRSFRTIGSEKNHIKFECVIPENNMRIDALLFNRVDDFREVFDDKFGMGKFDELSNGSLFRFKMDAIYKPSVNEFNGRRSMQIIINNFRLSED